MTEQEFLAQGRAGYNRVPLHLETLAALLQLQQVADQEQQALALIRTLNSGIEALPRKSAH